jgi:hypothetical protein
MTPTTGGGDGKFRVRARIVHSSEWRIAGRQGVFRFVLVDQPMAGTTWVRHEDFDAQHGRSPRGGTVLQSTDAPLFSALAAQWQSAGRMVPGQTDTEWAELVGRIPRLTGR